MNDKLREALAIVEKYGMKGDVIYKEIEALAASKQEPQLLQKSFDELAAERRASKTEPQAQAGEPDERLCKFYGVTTYADLVAAQARHIEKLQSKLEPVDGKQPGKARFA